MKHQCRSGKRPHLVLRLGSSEITLNRSAFRIVVLVGVVLLSLVGEGVDATTVKALVPVVFGASRAASSPRREHQLYQ